MCILQTRYLAGMCNFKILTKGLENPTSDRCVSRILWHVPKKMIADKNIYQNTWVENNIEVQSQSY